MKLIRQLWLIMGRVIFWAGWPVLRLYLRRTARTRVIVYCGEEVLVVQSWIGSGDWGLPGGGLHKDEAIVAGAARELYEETGLQIAERDLRHLGTFRENHRGLQYRCELLGVRVARKPKLKLQAIEIAAAAWISPLDETPRLEPKLREQLARWQSTV